MLVLSMHKEALYVREVLKAGARGYILKDAIDTELLSAMRSVARGDGYISPAVSGALLTDYREQMFESAGYAFDAGARSVAVDCRG